jgi:hypothetical protein
MGRFSVEVVLQGLTATLYGGARHVAVLLASGRIGGTVVGLYTQRVIPPTHDPAGAFVGNPVGAFVGDSVGN